MSGYDIKCSRLFFHRSWPYLSIPLLGIGAFLYFHSPEASSLHNSIQYLLSINYIRAIIYFIIPRSYFDLGLAESDYGSSYSGKCLLIYAIWGLTGWLCVIFCTFRTINTKRSIEVNGNNDTIGASVIALFTLVISYPKSHYTSLLGTYIDGQFNFCLKESLVIALGFYMIGFVFSNLALKRRLSETSGEDNND